MRRYPHAARARHRYAVAYGAAVVLLCVAATVCFALPGRVLLAEDALSAPTADSAADSGPDATLTMPSDPGTLVDTFMAGAEQRQGMAVCISVDDEVRAQCYYGHADALGTVAVDSTTAFEWGGCADLLVWACVMQLVEQGLLDLDDPVVDYMPQGVSLPDGYAGLSLMDLMNHTSGLDVAMNGTRSALPDGTASAAAALSLFTVEAQWDPGDVVAYSPYDALLAAVVVEQVAGVDFVDYVRAGVFEPLGMDGTYLMVGGSPARMARQGNGPSQLAGLADGIVLAPSLAQPAASTVFSCFGPVGDLVRFGRALMGVGGESALFARGETVEQMFTVSRTYPSLGIARVAHGLFAFPLASGVFGASSSTGSGFSTSLYMCPSTGLVVAIMVNQSDRADLTQGIPRVLVGRSESAVADADSPANALWVGTYQDASGANNGPAKLLTTLRRTTVSLNSQGVLLFNGLTATSLGAGVYSIDTANDQDVYRFHVSLERGSEFSRASSDSYIVPWFTLALEAVLLGSFAAAWALSVGYVLVAGGSFVRDRLAHRRRTKYQPAVLLLASLTAIAATACFCGVLSLVEGMYPAALGTLLVGEGAYVIVALAMCGWLAVTGWRGQGAWSRRQRAACIAVMLSAVAVTLNLAYWEMLP